MKITFNPSTKTQSTVIDTRMIQNSSTNFVYLYGVDAGWQIMATFTRNDKFKVANILGVYDLDPDDVYCYVIQVPLEATLVAGGLGVSILLYEPEGELFIQHATIATADYLMPNDAVAVPENLSTEVANALSLAISNLTVNKHEVSAIVGTADEIIAGITKDTLVYSKAKSDENETAITSNINTHKARTDNPHVVTKDQVGLGNVDNTSDVNKPVSTAQQAALDLKENLANKKTTLTDNSDSYYPTQKAVKTAVDLKADKATTIIGIDLQNDILLTEFKTALGNATTLLAGLMSATDKSRLDALHALLGTEADADAVVNTINEVLAIFATYPEGADIVTALAGKVDKVAGMGLSTNDYTDAEQAKVGHLPDNFTTFMAGYYTAAQTDVLLDQLTTAYGLTETAIDELAHNDTIALSTLTDYDYITLVLKHTDTHFIFDGKLIDPASFTNNGDFIQLNAFEGETQHSYGQLTYDGTTYLKFTASDALDTLVVKGYKKDAVTGLLVKMAHSGTNFLDLSGNAKEDVETLDDVAYKNEQEIRKIGEETITYRDDGKVSSVVADTVTTTPTYDEYGNITKITEVYALDSKTYETTVSYDKFGRISGTNKVEV